jgi:hypothetical protein
MGSDHEVYTDSTFGIPAVYLNDWPDRYIHTHRDVPENIDASKLERAAFIGAVTALALADAGAGSADALWRVTRAASLARTARFLAQPAAGSAEDAAAAARFHLWHERAIGESLARFVAITPALRRQLDGHAATTAALLGPIPPEPAPSSQGDAAIVYRRQGQPRGPLTAFGYDYLGDKLGAEKAKALALLRHEGARGEGGEYAYEALNLADGTRTVRQVRDALTAIYGPVPLEAVAEYLRAAASIGLVAPVK